ncbi:MAG: hypothetical protein GXO63_00765 [Candidatus Micrarchaeota archaeon]|nr:hypothetical protein [Candidatus Micrarchaeota archaeon]
MQKTVFGLLVSAALLIFLASILFQATKAQTLSRISGTIIFADSHPFSCAQYGSLVDCRYGSYGISTIPLALPKAGCVVKITVCDDRGQPPTKLIVGADPIPPLNASKNYSGVECGGTSPGICDFEGCDWEGNAVYSVSNYTPLRCPVGYTCGESSIGYCRVCECGSAGCPIYDNSFVYVSGYGFCCPPDHPIYDPASKSCVKNATVESRKIGDRCTVLTTKLETAFTDVTFADSSGRPLPTADYVAVSYIC